ncbi:hypothetical protein L1887_34725 [Cichorium endivia]|nr:hypothetical protein L1887_34725 [Cichorium endivia]
MLCVFCSKEFYCKYIGRTLCVVCLIKEFVNHSLNYIKISTASISPCVNNQRRISSGATVLPYQLRYSTLLASIDGSNFLAKARAPPFGLMFSYKLGYSKVAVFTSSTRTYTCPDNTT